MFTLVVVYDNLAIIDLVAHGIDWSELGCSVVGVATDGTQGSALIVANQPDIIITDIHMPGFDGLKMIETTKVFSPHSKVIFISAYDDFRYAQEAISLRACAYLLKPFSKKELVNTVRSVLGECKKDPAPKAAEDPAPTADNANLLVSAMLEYVRSHISGSLRLEELSRHFGFCTSYISSLIKKQTGQNYSDWVTQARIDYAKKLLKRPTHKIEEISFLVGYKNYITFYKVFVRNEGMSPTDYRKLKGGKESENPK